MAIWENGIQVNKIRDFDIRGNEFRDFDIRGNKIRDFDIRENEFWILDCNPRLPSIILWTRPQAQV